MGEVDPRQLLAQRLRHLRETHWPGIKVTQSQLAAALGAERPLSVPLISSWESKTDPKIPPMTRLEAYARFFASTRSVLDGEPHLLGDHQLTDAERRVQADLARELLRLRANAMRLSGTVIAGEIIESLNSGYWRFEDGQPITIICGQLPSEAIEKMPHSHPSDPDYIILSDYADLDSLVELFGHVRATNPANQVNFRNTSELVPDDYTTHLVSIGGVERNQVAMSLLNQFALPVRSGIERGSTEGPYFEVSGDDGTSEFRPRLDLSGDRRMLREDVALFARSINPFNRSRTATICAGTYSGGTFGAVRALTDARFRDRNTEYIRARFGHCTKFCILTRVSVEHGAPLTPDWTLPENRLFEWAEEA